MSNKFFPEKKDLSSCYTAEPPELDFVIPGLLSGTVGGLVSPGGLGKSWLALEIVHTIAGPQTLDLVPTMGIQKRGKVAVFAGEDAGVALDTRLHHLNTLINEKELEVVKSNLSIYETLGMDLQLENPDHADEFTKLIEGHRLAVIDTLTRFHGLDENKSEDAKRIMAALERASKQTGCTILYLHHVSKASAMAGLTELQQAARGSSVFVDNARWVGFVAGMSQSEAEDYQLDDLQRKGYLKFNVSKQNYGPPIADFWFRRGPGGVLYPTEALVKIERPTPPKKKRYRQAG